MTARSPRVGDQTAADRLLGSLAARTGPGSPPPDPATAAAVVRALADHTALMAALDYSRPDDSPWPDATSIGRWLHDTADQLLAAAARPAETAHTAPDQPDQPDQDKGNDKVDVDALPLTQNLIMEVLAARHRLGERMWPFGTRAKPALDALERLGLIGHKSGIVDRTRNAWLTDTGRRSVLSDKYVPPTSRRP